MPVSVKNRFACSWEHLFFFVKQRKYYFDLDAVRLPHESLRKSVDQRRRPRPDRPNPSIRGVRRVPRGGEPGSMHPNGRNPADFWSIAAETRTWGAILGKNGAVKVPGGAGWTGHVSGGQARIVREKDLRWLSPGGKNPGDCWDISTKPFAGGHFAVYPLELCERPIKAGCPRDGVVLDPFAGAGTTLLAAKQLGRRFLGIEINPEYVKLARNRLKNMALRHR